MKSQWAQNAINKQKEKVQFLNFLVTIKCKVLKMFYNTHLLLSKQKADSFLVLFPKSRETASKLKLLIVPVSIEPVNSSLSTTRNLFHH
jgi:hypothetical protein